MSGEPSDSTNRNSEQGTLTVRCPNCHNRVALSRDDALSEIRCETCGSVFSLLDDAEQTTEYRPVRWIAHFELRQHLGSGQFGAVWMAHDTELDRTVAVKIPRKERLDQLEVEQFLREARAAAQLRHANILRVHEVGREGDTVYIVSDFIRGAALADWLKQEQFSSREAADFCAKVADALHHAHEAGVVHRDLKPANILIDEAGEPYITDFGLAKRDSGEVTLTIDGRILGTPAYMSPEQARGEAHLADRRSDVYSLGVILFQLTTGELPFRGNIQMLVVQILNEDPPSPRKFNPNIPRNLETICLKAMSKEPARRYSTAGDMADDLRRFLRNEPVKARPIGLLSQLWMWCQRPQRIREAGLIMLMSAVVHGLWDLTAIPIVLFGTMSSSRRLAAFWHLAAFFVVFWLPMLVIGLGTMGRRPAAIWMGVLFVPLALILCLAMVLGLNYDFGGLYAEQGSVAPVFSLLSVLSACGWLYYLAALIAYYSNRNAVRWARQAANQQKVV